MKRSPHDGSLHPAIDRLRARAAEIEDAVLARVSAIDETSNDFVSSSGLGIVVSAAVEYGICVVERSEDFAPPPPPALAIQARAAARERISLDSILRHCFAGYGLFWDFLLEEYEREDDHTDRSVLKRWQRTLAAVFDHLMATVSEEYAREARDLAVTPEDRLARRLNGLLAGKRLDTSRLSYDFDGRHLGAVAQGPEAPSALRGLAELFDANLILLRRPEETAWGWIGSRRPFDSTVLERRLRSVQLPHTTLAVGEPAAGIEGWRRTHREAKAAFTVASRTPSGFARYSEVALLTSVLRDELLAALLRRLFLEPISRGDDDRQLLVPAVRAYLEAGFNATCAAAALGVSRHTLNSRLRRAEERLGKPLRSCLAELSVVLDLDALDAPPRVLDRAV